MKHAQTSPSKHPTQTDPHLALLGQLLTGAPELEFAVLVGSRAQGTARTKSDWDIALKWHPQADWLTLLGTQETLRRSIADILGTSPKDIDLIDLPRANLAMRANAAEDGIVLKGEDTLAWARFLTRTWRELEDFYWNAPMRFDLYQAETARIATEQSALLDVVKQRLAEGRMLTPLEQNGVLHALQVLIENAIGNAKQLLKARGETVPISAYDAFAALVRHGEIEQTQLPAWNAVIGLRNRIVHNYMNIDMTKVLDLVNQGRHEFVAEFFTYPAYIEATSIIAAKAAPTVRR